VQTREWLLASHSQDEANEWLQLMADKSMVTRLNQEKRPAFPSVGMMRRIFHVWSGRLSFGKKEKSAAVTNNWQNFGRMKTKTSEYVTIQWRVDRCTRS
jgi:hypothetical protein